MFVVAVWSVFHSATNAVAIADGRGRMNWRRSSAVATTSHRITTPTKIAIAGRYSRTCSRTRRAVPASRLGRALDPARDHDRRCLVGHSAVPRGRPRMTNPSMPLMIRKNTMPSNPDASTAANSFAGALANCSLKLEQRATQPELAAARVPSPRSRR